MGIRNYLFLYSKMEGTFAFWEDVDEGLGWINHREYKDFPAYRSVANGVTGLLQQIFYGHVIKLCIL
ncbi:hypothetical protein [Chitinophaga sp.]|uniref:hypothetical protein n=1 Tax=Chitinophaga sp. TaxID=1869181 RepID=UPI0031D2E534